MEIIQLSEKKIAIGIKIEDNLRFSKARELASVSGIVPDMSLCQQTPVRVAASRTVGTPVTLQFVRRIKAKPRFGDSVVCIPDLPPELCL
jgi:hypothetical protein